MLPFLHVIEEYAENLRKNSGIRINPWPIFIGGLALLALAFVFMPDAVALALSMGLFLAPLWMPFLLVGGAWRLFVILKESEFIAKQKHVLLEVKPPRNLMKTPLAMEAVISGLHQTGGEGTWYKKFIQGGRRPWFSLELASFEGQVHFFIWTRAGMRRIVETQVYAQYPGAQVVEVPDYTRMISATPDEWAIWGCNFLHTKPDPVPMKTYIEYGLDKPQKEPEQVDPLANTIEFLGQMRKGEYCWIQYTIRAHKGEKYDKKNAEGKTYTWKDEALELIEKIREKTMKPFIDAEGNERPGFPNPTKGQSEQIAAIERNVAKLAFDVGARGIYLTKPDRFDPVNISALIATFKQFSSEGWNGFFPAGGMTIFDDYPWEFRVEKLKKAVATELVDAYRRRQFFHEPHVTETMVMSTEELATLYHIPSASVETPTLPRIQSLTSEAPSNLPT